MDSSIADRQTGMPSNSVATYSRVVAPSDNDPNPIVIVRLSGTLPWISWHVQKSKLVKYSGFFRNMFKYDFKESRENRVVLHDDDQTALDALLVRIKLEQTDNLTIRWQLNVLEKMEVFVHLYFLVYKYDCLQLKDAAIEGLVSCVRSYWDPPSQDCKFAVILPHWNDFSSRLIDLATKNNNGEYPVELAPAIAEMWAGAQRRNRDFSRTVALIESDPALTMAVAKYYQEKYLQSEKDDEARTDLEATSEEADPQRAPTADNDEPQDLAWDDGHFTWPL